MWWQRAMRRARNIFGREVTARIETEEELRLHIELRVRELRAQGLSERAARRRANEAFGDWSEIMRESLQERGDTTTTSWIENALSSWLQDLKYASRLALKNRLFTAGIILTLAMGVAADTAVFSVVDGILLKPLAFRDPEQIVRIYGHNPTMPFPHMMNSAANLLDLKTQSDIFQDVASYREISPVLIVSGGAEQVSAAVVTREFFSAIGVAPAKGRIFGADEDGAGPSTTVLISDEFWRTHLNGSDAAIGESVTFRDGTYTVIGIMPPGFHYPDEMQPYQTQMWIGGDVIGREASSRGSRDLPAIARLKPGVKLARAKSELDSIATRQATAYPKDDGGWTYQAVPLQIDIVGERRAPILVLFGAVSVLLLIACANVANLLLARGARRRKEIAIRAVLGASRWRVIRQLLCESLVLAALGGTSGAAFSWAGIRMLRSTLPKNFPRAAEIHMSEGVLFFAIAIALLTGVVFGLVPALEAAKRQLGDSLSDGRGSSASGFRLIQNHRSRSALVVLQVSLSVVLLAGSGLLAKSFVRLISVNLGFDPSHVLTFWIELPQRGYEKTVQRRQFFHDATERFRGLPGVQSAALTSFLALQGSASTDYQVEGRPKTTDTLENDAGYKAITPEYFSVLRIPLLRGRLFRGADNSSAPPVVLINQAFAMREFPNADPLGKRLKLSWGGEPPWREIVGVVGDTRDVNLRSEAPPQFYVPIEQAWTSPSVAFVLRTVGDPLAAASSVRAVVTSLDKDQPVSAIQTLDGIYSAAIAEPRFETWLIGAFAVLALLLAAVGVQGVMAYSVSERIHEIGIRMAMGAGGGDVVQLIAWQGAVLIGVGLAIGLAGALASSKILATMLYGITATDPATFVEVGVLFAAIGLLACYLPARRATRVDPMIALRHE